MIEDTPATRALAGTRLRFDVVRTERPNSAEESAALQDIEMGWIGGGDDVPSWPH